jgi:hypothetical protein
MLFLDQLSKFSLMLVGACVYFTSGKILVTNISKFFTGEKVNCWTCLAYMAVLLVYTSTYFLMMPK